jgi:hypothetical protein
MGLKKGIDFFFGLGSVAYFVSLSLSSMGKGSSKPSGDKSKSGGVLSFPRPGGQAPFEV